MRIAWMTDVHLDFLDAPARSAFFDQVAASDAPAVLVGGDIGIARDVETHLCDLADRVARPVYKAQVEAFLAWASHAAEHRIF